jgi:hypothetical protein
LPGQQQTQGDFVQEAAQVLRSVTDMFNTDKLRAAGPWNTQLPLTGKSRPASFSSSLFVPASV